jgi:hypothetical protein
MQQINVVHLLFIGILYEELPRDGEKTSPISEDNGFAKVESNKIKDDFSVKGAK